MYKQHYYNYAYTTKRDRGKSKQSSSLLLAGYIAIVSYRRKYTAARLHRYKDRYAHGLQYTYNTPFRLKDMSATFHL